MPEGHPRVCRSHSEEICSGKCPFCPETHQLPEKGFTPNLMVQNMLISQLHKLNINFDKFEETKKRLEDLNKQFREIETFRNDPEYFVELTRQVDLRRERLFESIRLHSDLIVTQIEEWKSGVLTRAKENGTRINKERAEECKERLGQLNSMFASLEIDNIKMDEITHPKKSKELEELLKQMAEEYKGEILGGKTFELKTNDIKMEEVFGTLQMGEFSLQMEVLLISRVNRLSKTNFTIL